MKRNPIMSISSSEPDYILDKLSDISDIDTYQIYPDYRIYSKLGFKVDISRGTINDVLSNKMNNPSHIVNELSSSDGDLKIFLLEGFVGDSKGKIVLPGGKISNWNYTTVMNNILIACINQGAFLYPSPNINSTCSILREWNNLLFQKEVHNSLQIRPSIIDGKSKAENNSNDIIKELFSLDFDSYQSQEWWLSDIPSIGIGKDRAKEALKYFHSITGLVIAPISELVKVPKWGRTTAINFRKFIDKELYK